MDLLRIFLAPLTPLYAGVVRLRNRAFDRDPSRCARLPVPVLSIGNLSSGGTGKTPLTLALAEHLQAQGWSNQVLSRGYGGRRKEDPMEVLASSDPALAGDEPVLLASKLGNRRVVVGRRRLEAGLLALEAPFPPRCLILDDGFQHRALHRDLDLLLLDGVRRWGNGHCLPLGPLREPMDSARRAHALVVTRASRSPREEILAWWERHGSGGPVFFVDFRIQRLRAWPQGQIFALPSGIQGPYLAFGALGHPEAFFADLLVAGVRWVETKSFPDHHRITPRELLLMELEATRAGAVGLVCTEKDAVKLDGRHLALLSLPLFVAEQAPVGIEPLFDWVVGRLEALPPPGPSPGAPDPLA
ncbi:MAG: tetraacyldisaccharide 4'-kinase [Acidobacteria bacterium]|nr:tetraacyldisaccharide 4'-kinase [Acidobacteriota bacterium]